MSHHIPAHKGKKLPAEWCENIRKGRLRNARTLEERYWSYVDKRGADECWPWKGSLINHGYGRLWVGTGRDDGRIVYAHRIGWELAGHEVPTWPMVLDHTCKNRSCQNVRHLRAVTQGINSTENSISPMAKNAQKKRCLNGHEYTPENTYYYLPKNLVVFGRKRAKPMPQRKCLACVKAKHPGTKRRAGPPI